MKNSNTSERLKEYMNKTGLKQVDILDKVKPYCEKYGEKINKSHLSQWVSGTNEPNNKKLTILSLALNLDEVWLMGYDVPMEKEVNAGDVLADVFMDSELMDHVEKLNKLSAANKQIVYNMIDALTKGE